MNFLLTKNPSLKKKEKKNIYIYISFHLFFLFFGAGGLEQVIFFNKGSKSKIYVYIIYIHFFFWGGGGKGGWGKGLE